MAASVINLTHLIHAVALTIDTDSGEDAAREDARAWLHLGGVPSTGLDAATDRVLDCISDMADIPQA